MEQVVLDRESSYRGADVPRAQRATRLLWSLGCLTAAAVVPFYPPTQLIGSAGWYVVGAYVPIVLGVLAFVSRRSVGFRGLLAATCVGLVLITVLQVLSGPESPFLVIDLLLVCCVALTHPPQIALPFAVVTVVSRIGLAFAQGTDRTDAMVHAVGDAVIWIVLAAVLSSIMRQVRQQRLDLHFERSTDPLTGLLNRRSYNERLARDVDVHRAEGRPLSLLVGDLNGFKALNDSYGHLEGDRQLVAVARAIEGVVRGDDTCFRWGGDEFAVLLPGADEAVAARVGDRVQATVSAACSDPTPLTMGIGHATLLDGDTPEDLTARADAMLMERKRSRRVEEPEDERLAFGPDGPVAQLVRAADS